MAFSAGSRQADLVGSGQVVQGVGQVPMSTAHSSTPGRRVRLLTSEVEQILGSGGEERPDERKSIKAEERDQTIKTSPFIQTCLVIPFHLIPASILSARCGSRSKHGFRARDTWTFLASHPCAFVVPEKGLTETPT